jgi:hypothetical protein
MAPQKRTVSLAATMFPPQFNSSPTSRSDLQTNQQRKTPTGWLHGLAMIPDFRMTWDEKNSASKKQILYDFFSLQIVSIECLCSCYVYGTSINSSEQSAATYIQRSLDLEKIAKCTVLFLRLHFTNPRHTGLWLEISTNLYRAFKQSIRTPKVRCESYILRWLLSAVVEKLSLAPRAKIITSIERFSTPLCHWSSNIQEHGKKI